MHKLAHGHDQTTEEAYHAAALYLHGCLGTETAGSYTTEIFSKAKLGSETEMLAAVIRGDLAMATVTAANAAVTIPELGFFSAPYLFQGPRLPGSLFSPQWGLCPPHDGVGGRWRINVENALASFEASQILGRSRRCRRPDRDI